MVYEYNLVLREWNDSDSSRRGLSRMIAPLRGKEYRAIPRPTLRPTIGRWVNRTSYGRIVFTTTSRLRTVIHTVQYWKYATHLVEGSCKGGDGAKPCWRQNDIARIHTYVGTEYFSARKEVRNPQRPLEPAFIQIQIDYCAVRTTAPFGSMLNEAINLRLSTTVSGRRARAKEIIA